MTITKFDRRVLDASIPGRLAQEVVEALGLRLTEANLARVLRSMAKLTKMAREVEV